MPYMLSYTRSKVAVNAVRAIRHVLLMCAMACPCLLHHYVIVNTINARALPPRCAIYQLECLCQYNCVALGNALTIHCEFNA